MTRPSPALRGALERAAAEFDAPERLANDPLGVVREFPPQEREVVAFVAAPLAYGAVSLIRRAIRQVLEPMGASPSQALDDYRRGDFVRWRPDFVYRMTRAEDVDAYLAGLAALRRGGGLQQAFLAGDAGAGDLRGPLEVFVSELRKAMAPCGRGGRYLTPDPATGSSTKRWYLLLRWLVRADDGVDLGLWDAVSPSRLVLPLDTHVARLVRDLGLTDRQTADYRMARQATDALLRLDPADPLRFDMPLCHLGVAEACRHRWDAKVCPACPLRRVCRWTRGRREARA